MGKSKHRVHQGGLNTQICPANVPAANRPVQGVEGGEKILGDPCDKEKAKLPGPEREGAKTTPG